MCTGFIKKGKDIVFGFNMDLPDGLWDFQVYPEEHSFFVGMKVDGWVWKTHGVNALGNFANLPYMNAPERGQYQSGSEYQRLDLLVDGYLAGELDYAAVRRITEAKQIVNVPQCSMHSLFGDAEGRMLLVEPGFSALDLQGDFSVISNFPLQEDPKNLDPKLEGWYGRDRQRKAEELLATAGEAFDLQQAMEVLEAVSLTRNAPTRVSFAYSVNTRRLRYALERSFADAKEYQLCPYGDASPRA
jgi:hypothetical protein